MPSLGRAQPSGASPEPAMQPGRLALMPAASLDPASRELATALDPVVLAQLEAVAGVKAAARPALDLPAMQLALDCVGETPECLRAVNAQSSSDSLLAPSVQNTGGETVVTLLYFDARGEGALRSVVRRHSGPDVQRAALDAVPGMLRELFAIPEPASKAEPSAQPEQPPLDQSAIEPQAEPVEKPFPVAPVIVGAAGAVLMGVGAVFGVAAKASEKDYRDDDPKDAAQADATVDKLDTAKTQAVLCDVGLAVGGAALAAGTIWLVVELSGDDSGERVGTGSARTQLSLAPRIAPGVLGVSLAGAL